MGELGDVQECDEGIPELLLPPMQRSNRHRELLSCTTQCHGFLLGSEQVEQRLLS